MQSWENESRFHYLWCQVKNKKVLELQIIIILSCCNLDLRALKDTKI